MFGHTSGAFFAGPFFRLTVIGLVVLALLPANSHGQSIVSTSNQPFVIGIRPVIGPNGPVGGVLVDADGVVSRAKSSDAVRLKRAWLTTRKSLPPQLNRKTRLRMVSLPRLETAIARYIERGTELPDEILFLAGLERVEYVFVFPERKDLVLAGPADGWGLGERGAFVGASSGQPKLRLDDLIEALCTAHAASTGSGISCSIDPTGEGLSRLQRLLGRRNIEVNRRSIRLMEEALGSQPVSVTGVSPNSHFARVMVAADYVMKRLAMGFEQAPVAGMPSYMELLRTKSSRISQIASPRWWLAVDYEPVLKSSTGLAWQLRGQGTKVMTEDGYLGAGGRVINSGRPNPLAAQWAHAMTENYEALSTAVPVFAELRGCMDLAVIAALITREGLLSEAGCDLPLLTNERRIDGPRYEVPKTVPSRASLIRGHKGWIVSVSGGVDVDSWSVLSQFEMSGKLDSVRDDAQPVDADRWWWD